MEEMDAALKAEYGQFSPYQGVDVLLLDPKKKLQLFAATSYLENKLEKASPEEVQSMVDSGLFKSLCSMMAIAPDESEEADAVMSVCTDRLTAFVEALPELSAKAWSYGAVRPITAVLLRKWDLSKPDFLSNDALKASILFLEAMGQPCHEQLSSSSFRWGDKESPQIEARKAAGKLYRWLLKKGAIDAMVKIWCALPEYGEAYEESTNYEELASSCGLVLWYANLVHKKDMVMASKGGNSLTLQSSKSNLISAVFRKLLTNFRQAVASQSYFYQSPLILYPSLNEAETGLSLQNSEVLSRLPLV